MLTTTLLIFTEFLTITKTTPSYRRRKLELWKKTLKCSMESGPSESDHHCHNVTMMRLMNDGNPFINLINAFFILCKERD